MPFKSRKKKIGAASRRITITSSGAISYSATEKDVGSGESKRDSVPVSKPLSAVFSDLNYTLVRAELVKIVLLAVFIIGLQIALKFSHLPFIR